MGYTTTFDGCVTVDPPLNDAERAFLEDLAATRRMKRTKGPLFVGGSGFKGQDHEDDVIDANTPPDNQPGLWLQWVPAPDGEQIEWDGEEKFYNAELWMKYLVENLLAPSAREYITAHQGEDDRLASFTCDHVLNGEIFAEGEEPGDRWKLIVQDNKVLIATVRAGYGEPEQV